MGVMRFEKEVSAAVAPSRMFKAFFLEAHNFLPKLVPQAIKSVEILQGDGGAGSIKITNFADGGNFKYAKHRIDELDKDNFRCKYTVIEGDMLGTILESIVYDVKFEASGNGGSICKVASEFHTKGDQEIKEEALKEAEEKAMGLHKIVEAHLLANPDLYA
ncbi:hypothetical protein WN944_025390 [Citrus x changshan-huyou]|uniref:Bet v I/Major latex protein domain-containing protein n=3 Tax=Citrus TaxID=2706 RepID=A0AAP0LQB8_9ROSI|nr:major allergen Pru ar 1-like [Citrus sinensis]KAH9766024.1 Bet v 1 domain-containing protein [Citrus sinensis]